MGYWTETCVEVDYCGNFDRESYVKVGDDECKITPKTSARFKGCTSSKEYAESIGYFAHLVLVKKNIPNDGWFEKRFAESKREMPENVEVRTDGRCNL